MHKMNGNENLVIKCFTNGSSEPNYSGAQWSLFLLCKVQTIQFNLFWVWLFFFFLLCLFRTSFLML